MKRYLLIILLFFAFPAFAADPVLFFSDLVDGPDTGIGDGLGSGAIVTIWGKNLGSSQGSSKVYFKDSGTTAREAAYVYYWCNADGGTSGGGPSDLYTYHGYQEIAFSIPDSATGAGTIYVEVDGVNSNTLPFFVRTSGNILHTGTTGQGSPVDEPGCGAFNDPCATADYVVNDSNGDIAIAGSIVYVHGVHEGRIIVDTGPGTVGNRCALVAYPGTSPEAEDGDDAIKDGNTVAGGWVLSKYIMRAGDGGGGSSNDSCLEGMFQNGRIVGNYCTDRGNGAGQWGSGSSGGVSCGGTECENVKFFGNHIYEWGSDSTGSLSHQTYFNNRSGSSIVAPEVGWNLIIEGNGKNALHFYDEGVCGGLTGNLKIHDNIVVNERGSGIVLSGCYETSGEVHIYNNIIIGSGLGPKFPDKSSFPQCGIFINANGTYKVYNNTLYNYANASVGFQPTGYQFGAFCAEDITTLDVEYRNNIVYDVNDGDYASVHDSSEITGSSNNIWYDGEGGTGTPANAPAWDTSPDESDPLFVNTGSDFHLQEGSPARDTGYNTSSTVAQDLDGLNRPQETNVAIGAYEYAGYILKGLYGPFTLKGGTVR